MTCSEDGTVKVWSWTDSRLIRTLDVAEAMISAGGKNKDEEQSRRVKIVRMSVGTESGKAFAYLAVDAASRGKPLSCTMSGPNLVLIVSFVLDHQI